MNMFIWRLCYEYCNDWECQKLREYVDEIINYIAKDYGVEVE